MLILQGSNALSKFRINKLLSVVQTHTPEIISIQTRFIHFVNENRALDKKEDAQLNELLNYGETCNSFIKGSELIVIPRPGTISPWSSKASDIAHNSGLNKIIRIERGVIYLFEIPNEKKLTKRQIERIAPLIHDRMTEIIIEDENEAVKLFNTTEPTPIEKIVQ